MSTEKCLVSNCRGSANPCCESSNDKFAWPQGSRTLEKLGVVKSFSRPRVSDDNPYVESTFRTCKYRPGFPGAFASLGAAQTWVADFVEWYKHQHSAIRFVAPADRHEGRDVAILARRAVVYEAAKARHPERWSRNTRNWTPIDIVELNPRRDGTIQTTEIQPNQT